MFKITNNVLYLIPLVPYFKKKIIGIDLVDLRLLIDSSVEL